MLKYQDLKTLNSEADNIEKTENKSII